MNQNLKIQAAAHQDKKAVNKPDEELSEISTETILGGPRHKVVVHVPKRPEKGRRLQGRENGGDEIKALDPETFSDPRWKCLYAEQHSSGQFKGFRIQARMEMINIWESVEPETNLKRMLSSIWSYTNYGAEKSHGQLPDYFLVRFDGKNIEYPLNRNFRGQYSDPYLDSFVNELDRVDQSNKARNMPSIFEASFIVDITAVVLTGRRNLGKKQQTDEDKKDEDDQKKDE